MKTASWEVTANALVTMLNQANAQLLYMADVYSITLSNGNVVNYTSADVNITFNNTTYPIGPTIDRGTTSTKVGIEVDTLKITIGDDGSNLIGGVPILAFAATGGFDGARVVLQRVFANTPTSPFVGAVQMFSGRVGQVEGDRYQAVIEIQSDLELLTNKVPRNVYQSSCSNTLYDVGCTLSRASFTATGSVAANTSNGALVVQSLNTFASDFFTNGVIEFTSGENSGIRRTVKHFQAGGATQGIFVFQAFPNPVAANDTFSISAGCDKTPNTCNSRFSNLINFRGLPWIPNSETVMGV